MIKSRALSSLYFLSFLGGLLALHLPALGQARSLGQTRDQEVKTTVREVTVFPQGAQIFSQETVALTPGETTLRFTGLSPYILAQSIQVQSQGALTVLSVNLQENFMDELEKSPELIRLESQMDALTEQITLEQTHLSVLKDEMAFLNDNRRLMGNGQSSTSQLQQHLEFYSKRLTELKMKEIERNETLEELLKNQQGLLRQIQALSGAQHRAAGEILVRVDVQKGGSYPFALSYLTENAGWYPSYDVRAKNISEPVQITYKANIRQDTKMDWNNVRLTLSTANPHASAVAPSLQPYFLSENSRPPSYRLNQLEARGQVINASRTPLSGVQVRIEGSTIATVTDAQGNFSLALPDQNSRLSFHLIGYVSQTQVASNQPMRVVLGEEYQQLDELQLSKSVARVAESVAAAPAASSSIMIRGMGNTTPIPTAQVAQQTSVEFSVERPYTILSDNKNYTVDIDQHQLNTQYHYLSIPKVDKDAFLIAELTDWEQLHLLDGEANLFFEDTYVGKTVLAVSQASDTLRVSLGRDKNVVVQREKGREYNRRQFIGSRQEQSKSWSIRVKNQKTQPISLILLDQVPVSTQADIEVQVQNTSRGLVNAENGEVRWEFSLDPGTERTLELHYLVRYPKNKTLIIE